MRADAFLAAAERLPLARFPEVTGGGGLVVCAPHPDDESLGCGGLIAEACAQLCPTRVAVVSDGAGSHPNSSSYPPDRLRALREQEAREAIAMLGLAPHHLACLGLPDRSVPSAGARAEAAADILVALAEEVGASVLVTTWRHDPHCDHVAAAAIARLARSRRPTLRLFEYPVWGWTLPPETEVGDAPRGFRLDISRHLAAKRDAIAAHRSQTSALIDDDPDGFRLSAAMLDRFAGPFETFLEAEP